MDLLRTAAWSCIGNCEYSKSSNDTAYDKDPQVNKTESETHDEDDDDDNSKKHSEENDADQLEENKE